MITVEKKVIILWQYIKYYNITRMLILYCFYITTNLIIYYPNIYNIRKFISIVDNVIVLQLSPSPQGPFGDTSQKFAQEHL